MLLCRTRPRVSDRSQTPTMNELRQALERAKVEVPERYAEIVDELCFVVVTSALHAIKSLLQKVTVCYLFVASGQQNAIAKLSALKKFKKFKKRVLCKFRLSIITHWKSVFLVFSS